MSPGWGLVSGVRSHAPGSQTLGHRLVGDASNCRAWPRRGAGAAWCAQVRGRGRTADAGRAQHASALEVVCCTECHFLSEPNIEFMTFSSRHAVDWKQVTMSMVDRVEKTVANIQKTFIIDNNKVSRRTSYHAESKHYIFLTQETG